MGQFVPVGNAQIVGNQKPSVITAPVVAFFTSGTQTDPIGTPPLCSCLSASSSVLSVMTLPEPDSFSTSFWPSKPVWVEMIISTFLYPTPLTDAFSYM